MQADENTIRLDYNTEMEKLRMPEYGRNVRRMVSQVKQIEDRAKRTEQARAVVRVMELLNPQVHSEENWEQKLWDHLYAIADFDLDVDSPYPAPSASQYQTRPLTIPLKKKPVKATHYGRNIESIIDLIAGEPDGEQKTAMIRSLAIYMRQQYLIWNKDSVARRHLRPPGHEPGIRQAPRRLPEFPEEKVLPQKLPETIAHAREKVFSAPCILA